VISVVGTIYLAGAEKCYASLVMSLFGYAIAEFEQPKEEQMLPQDPLLELHSHQV
jgi:hypothetical protein